MAAFPPVDSAYQGVMEIQPYNHSREKLDEHGHLGSTWYFSRREIEENSPSRRDGIDLKKEAYLRKSYCTFLQDLGMRLKVPQVTIATAIIFCHRFFLRQSHVKNDRRTVATVCMFLAGKVEETPRPLKDVIIVSYEIIHKKDPVAVQRIKQREVYEQQKELILLGERVVLATLGFDLNVHHPYKPLVEAIKKFKVAQNALAQVAWNFVNDGLRTSLCLQFKPHHIAAGAIFLAAKFLKVKLPSDGEKVWWQEFDVTPRQLEEVSNQMLELYEQNRATAASNGNEAEGNSVGGSTQRIAASAQASVQESTAENGQLQAAVTAALKHGNPSASSRHVVDQSLAERQSASHKIVQNESNDYGEEPRSKVWDNCADGVRENVHHESGKNAEALNGKTSYRPEKRVDDPGRLEPGGKGDGKECSSGLHTEGHKVYSPIDAIKKIDKDKVKAALEKRRKSRGDLSKKIDVMNEDDLIERELESGVELAVEDERSKKERRHSMSGASHQYPENRMGETRSEPKDTTTEEGELSLGSRDFPFYETGSRKRKARTPDRQMEGKEGFDLPHRLSSSYSKHQERAEDGISIGRHDSQERDDRKHG